MHEFEYFAVIGWIEVFWKDGGEQRTDFKQIGLKKCYSFPDEEERKEMAIKMKATFLTIEKRYEYSNLPFEE